MSSQNPTAATAAIAPVSGQTRHAPASFLQQRLWFLDRLQPGDLSYLIPWSFRLKGDLDVSALERTLNELVRRHELLRTTFALSGEDVVQVIAEALTVPLPVTDLSSFDDAEERARAIASEETRRPFDLQQGPLLRACLLRLNPQDHILLMTLHHIIFDGWSRGILAREMSEIYAAFRRGEPSPLPPPRLQYADYASWQQNYLSGKRYEKQLAYWKEHLTGAPGTLELPTDRPRPLTPSVEGASIEFSLPADLVSRANALATENRASLFMVLIAAYQALLSRYTGLDDIVVGIPTANRSRSEVEGLIGPLVNNLALRLDLAGDPTFRELLSRAREMALNAFSNQDMPFEKLVQEISPDRNLGQNPLFQVVFSLQNASREAFDLAGVEVSVFRKSLTTAKFDLSAFLTQSGNTISGRVEYKTDLFDQTTIDRFIGHYLVMLEAIVENPDARIAELPLLTRNEREQLITGWNATQHDYPRERSLHQFIEEQVERTPNAPALVFEKTVLSYSELNARANRLAHRLRNMGVGPEKLVGVCAVRSIEMVVGLLGIIKAGGAYLPIDPEYPRDRIAVVLEDAEPVVLLTLERVAGILPDHSIPTICLDRDWSTLANEPSANPAVVTTGKDQAYVIYTSGSTGRPKGVPNVHEGIVNRLLWMQHAYGLTEQDRVVQKTPFSFDVSVWEFFWPLMTGACLVVARPDGHKDPVYLVDLIRAEKITTIHFVPSMLRAFLEYKNAHQCASLRRVICSGEALTTDLQDRFFEKLGAELHNLYGPTEASVDVSYWECKPHSKGVSVPIGKPIWNTQLYILDRLLQPVPIGVAGELHIGGVGLARGYLKRPELTAEKFIRDPFSSDPAARLYKTGDLTRFLPDGNIEYLGRIDHQVKIRGLRIELGEIEATLAQHPAVQSSIVTAREDVPGDKRLVGYVVRAKDAQQPGNALVIASLREFLREKLPAYMVPNDFVMLDHFPMLPNGKLNRRALPAPDSAANSASSYEEPRGEEESMLAAIWREVLKLEKVGRNDNFFNVGGHSLLAVRLFSRIEAATGRNVPLNALFTAPTIAELAVRVFQETPTVAKSSLHPARPEGSRPPLYAAHGIGGTVLTFRELTANLPPDQPVYCLEAFGLNGSWSCLEELAALHLKDILAFQPEGPYHLTGSSFGGMVVFEIAQQLQSMGHEVAFLGLLDTANLGRRNLRTRRQRLRAYLIFLEERGRLHVSRLLSRKLSQWPRYAVGRMLAVGRRLYGGLWNLTYKSVKTSPINPVRKLPSVLLNMKRVYHAAGTEYVPKPYPGKLTLFRAMVHADSRLYDPSRGWGGLAAGGLEVIDVPGDHNTMLKSDDEVKVLAAEMAKCLNRSREAKAAAEQPVSEQLVSDLESSRASA